MQAHGLPDLAVDKQGGGVEMKKEELWNVFVTIVLIVATILFYHEGVVIPNYVRYDVLGDSVHKTTMDATIDELNLRGVNVTWEKECVAWGFQEFPSRVRAYCKKPRERLVILPCSAEVPWCYYDKKTYGMNIGFIENYAREYNCSLEYLFSKTLCTKYIEKATFEREVLK